MASGGAIKGWADSRCDDISPACLVSHISFALSPSSSCLPGDASPALPAFPAFIVCMGHKLWSKALLNALCWSPSAPLCHSVVETAAIMVTRCISDATVSFPWPKLTTNRESLIRPQVVSCTDFKMSKLQCLCQLVKLNMFFFFLFLCYLFNCAPLFREYIPFVMSQLARNVSMGWPGWDHGSHQSADKQTPKMSAGLFHYYAKCHCSSLYY